MRRDRVTIRRMMVAATVIIAEAAFLGYAAAVARSRELGEPPRETFAVWATLNLLAVVLSVVLIVVGRLVAGRGADVPDIAYLATTPPRGPVLRFTIRRLMLAIALVGVVIGVPVGWVHSLNAEARERVDAGRRISDRYRETAAFHRKEAAWLVSMAGSGSILSADVREDGGWRWPKISEAERERRIARRPSERLRSRASWHDAVAKMYEDAARDPWFPLPPEPPEPE